MKRDQAIRTAVALMLAITFTSPALSASASADAAVQAVFDSFDQNKDGLIDQEEADNLVYLTFKGMDADFNGRISEADFDGFSMGLKDIAETSGKAKEYAAARTAMFQRCDENKKGEINFSQYRHCMITDFAKSVGIDKDQMEGRKVDVANFAKVKFIEEMMASLK
jgi:Ca2+-binding EF-hand superfamily protein